MRSAPLCVLLALFCAGGLLAQKPLEKEEPKRSRLSPALDLLPAGSTLKEVRIPRYDKEKRRAALVRAGVLEVLSEQQVRGDDIELRLFSKQDQESLRVKMATARYSRESGILEAQEVLTVVGENINARGTGGLFHLDSRRGFVHGPVSTEFLRPPEKEDKKEDQGQDDNLKPAPVPLELRPPLAVMTPEFLEPGGFSATELGELDHLLQSRSQDVLADRAPTRELMTRSQQLSAAADVGLQSFSYLVKRQDLISTVGDQVPAPPAPTDENLRPGAILVTCEGGMFIDTEKGQISYLRNIGVVEARFTMSCSNSLKAFFEKKEGTDNKQPPNVEDFSDLKTIVASGGVRVIRHDPKKKRPPIIATADTAIVDVKTGDMVLQGGTPVIQQGLNAIRAGEPDLYLRFYANGNVFAEKGRWTTEGDLANLKADQEDRNKNAPAEPQDLPATTPATATDGAAAEQPKKKKGAEGPRLITATCTGGIYFDAQEGHIVYLEAVEITEPRFTLRGADELKVLLRRKPTAGPEELEGLEAWSDVDAIVARGNLTVTLADAAGKRQPVTATAAQVVLNTESGDVTLRGGSPAIRQGTNSLVAGQPGLYLRFYQNGSLFTEPGKWTTTGDLANLRPKPGAQKNPPRIISASCKGGLSFDSLKGHIVYRDGIKVQEPRFNMDCAGEMTIYLAKRPDAGNERLEGPEAFSDVSKIRATGGVTVVRRDPRGKTAAITASAQTALYDAQSGDIALQDGLPMIRQGKSYLKADEPGLFIRFYANGSFFTNKGRWITDVSDSDFNALRKQRENPKGN